MQFDFKVYSVDFQFLLQLIQLGGVLTEYQHLFLDPSENEVTGKNATQVAGCRDAESQGFGAGNNN